MYWHQSVGRVSCHSKQFKLKERIKHGDWFDESGLVGLDGGS